LEAVQSLSNVIPPNPEFRPNFKASTHDDPSLFGFALEYFLIIQFDRGLSQQIDRCSATGYAHQTWQEIDKRNDRTSIFSWNVLLNNQTGIHQTCCRLQQPT
jgi:hypothetical protein